MSFELTERQFELYKKINGLKIRGARNHSKKWHSRNDKRLLALQLSIREFDEKYIFPLQSREIKHHYSDELSSLGYIKLIDCPPDEYYQYVANQHKVKSLKKRLYAVEGEYLRCCTMLKILDMINGSLVYQGVL